jgi:predicted permease
MNVLAYLRSISAKLSRRSTIADEMEEEVLAHIALRADDLMRSGMDRAGAERQARIEFGAREKFKEESYAALGGNFLEILMRDIRLALRMMRKSKGFTFAAILTLALAICANAVVFGVMDTLILRPLRVPQQETLYGTQYGDGSGFQSYLNYVDLRDRNHSFEDLAAFNFAFVGFDTGNNPVQASGFAVTGNYFDVLRIQPFLGQFFHASDEHGPNSAPYVVLSHPYWHSHFQDDHGVVGRVVLIDKHPFTIVGVAPQGFGGTLIFVPTPDFFVPVVNEEQLGEEGALTERANTKGLFEVLGHLRPGVSVAQANADVNAIGDDLQKKYPKEVSHKPVSLAHEGLTSFAPAVRAFVAGLTLLSGLILLAACANLGSLFAAHIADRSKEVALRLALGSTRKRILRQLLTEAVLVSLAGGGLGLWAGVVLLGRLATWQPFPGAPVHIPATVDARICIVALGLALVSGFLFGIVPLRLVMRARPYEIVKAGVTGAAGRRITLRDALVVLQIAICGVLVTASMVAVRGLMRSLNSDLGFEPRNTMVLIANMATGGYRGDSLPAMQKRFMDGMATIPGVERVGIVNDYPPLAFAAGSRVNVFKDETREPNQSNVAARPYRYAVSPGYFAAAATSILSGRDFNWHDNKNSPPVAVANREFATRMFGSVDNAVGRFYRVQDGTRVQIVGVAENGKYMALTEDQQPAIFLSFLQDPATQACIIVRSNRSPEPLAAAMRIKLKELDRGLPPDIQSWTTLLDVVMFPARVATLALGVLGVMGGILSITGIFGIAAHSVSRRLKELGIRVALGARRSEVLGSALGRALKLLACGSVAGLLLGLLASRVLAAIVYQATPRDPLVLAGVVAAMALLGLLATWIPAQRALAVDPMVLLREE